MNVLFVYAFHIAFLVFYSSAAIGIEGVRHFFGFVCVRVALLMQCIRFARCPACLGN